MSAINFSELPIEQLAKNLNEPANELLVSSTFLKSYQQKWQSIQNQKKQLLDCDSLQNIEKLEVDWLIQLFNHLFDTKKVQLVRGENEPEYFPAKEDCCARIEFAHGFFQSALHEISHWCIAGAHRRTLPDFGYWYAPDGRTEAQQKAFEKVEIKPQAIECLYSLMCGRRFRVSQDNLDAEFDTSQSTFANDVYSQAMMYIKDPQRLPKDAQTLLTVLANVCHGTIDDMSYFYQTNLNQPFP